MSRPSRGERAFMKQAWMDYFHQSIYNAVSTEQLRGLRDRMHDELRPSLFRDTQEWNEHVNAAHDRLIAGTISLAERTLRLEGLGTPPAPYAFIVVGSAGRLEQTLWSDQDNGIVFADPEAGREEEAELYFRRLAERVHSWLMAAGYPPCPGGVVCANPFWRKPISAWRSMIAGWMANPDWEAVRYLLMLADIRCLEGDEELVGQLRTFYAGELAAAPGMLKHMLQNTLHHKMTIGVLGNLITERYGEDAGSFDVKYGAYIPLVNGIRLLALAHGADASATLDRLEVLRTSGAYSDKDVDRWNEAFVTALELRSLVPLANEGGYYGSRGMLDLDTLGRAHRKQLKSCLRAGMALQQTVRKTVERLDGESSGKRGDGK